MTFDNRITDLIAIGASVAANCQSCVEYHLAKAAEYGIDQIELTQAVEIGRRVRKGAAARVDQAADRLLHEDASAASGATSDEPPASGAGCCASTIRPSLMTETTDAIALVVSEETGEISFSREGHIRINVSVEELERSLRQEFEQ
jgi:AhpD family alkylhydroperoxidase